MYLTKPSRIFTANVCQTISFHFLERKKNKTFELMWATGADLH